MSELQDTICSTEISYSDNYYEFFFITVSIYYIIVTQNIGALTTSLVSCRS